MLVNPFRTAVPFWGQNTWNLSGLYPQNGTAVLKGLRYRLLNTRLLEQGYPIAQPTVCANDFSRSQLYPSLLVAALSKQTPCRFLELFRGSCLRSALCVAKGVEKRGVKKNLPRIFSQEKGSIFRSTVV